MPDGEGVKNPIPIVLVDDEPQLLLTAQLILEKAGYSDVIPIQDSREVPALLSHQEAGLIILDLLMPHLSGAELLTEIINDFSHIPVIVMTARNEVDTAVQCIRSGAFDYIVKPFEKNRLLSSVEKALEMGRLRNEISSMKNHFLSGELRNPEAFASLITRNKKMFALFQYMEVIGCSPQPVLLIGETGAGKELFAQTIHKLSRRKGEFIAVNVAGLDETVLSDTLFGHTRGAYTGADKEREGLIARAAGGTFFLDEIGDLSPSAQVKMLRLLQEHEYYPLGSDRPRRTDARIVVATHQPLPDLIKEGRFRKDLYYRLKGHQISIPPLRDRLDDLPLLLEAFLEEAAQSMQKRKPTSPSELLSLLSAYDFPGNVRELRSMVYDAVARHRSGVLSMNSFREMTNVDRSLPTDYAEPDETAQGLAISGRFPTLKEAESFLINEALKRSRDNQGIAASLLGINRTTLNKRLNK
ncbi:MAG TPA: sigma-54 dependent transcriptional regulator [Thermodesulfovibrionales bacterium]|nr:sigma-54 dependent transcriptional regulator [Thermodesulfovibrionales bacterium]